MLHGGIQMCQLQSAFRHRAGLVRANRGDPTDVLDRDRPANQGSTFREPIHADAQKERKDDGKLLRQRRGRECHRADDRVQPPVALYEACDDENDARRKRRDHQRRDQPPDGTLERRVRVRHAPSGADNVSVEGLGSSKCDEERRSTCEEPRPGEAPVLVCDRLFRGSRRFGVQTFPNRIGLAGQRRFVGLDVRAVDDDAICRKRLTARDHREIAGHHLRCRDIDQHPVSHDAGAFRQAALQSLSRRLRPAMEEHVHQHERTDRDKERDRLDDLSNARIQSACRCEEPNHRVLRRIPRKSPPRVCGHLHNVVASVRLRTERRVGGRETTDAPLICKTV